MASGKAATSANNRVDNGSGGEVSRLTPVRLTPSAAAKAPQWSAMHSTWHDSKSILSVANRTGSKEEAAGIALAGKEDRAGIGGGALRPTHPIPCIPPAK